MNLTVIALAIGFGIVGYVLLRIMRAVRSAAKSEDRAEAAEEQLEMNREADAIEKQVAELSDKALDEELSKWSRKQ